VSTQNSHLFPGILSELDIKAVIGLGNPGPAYYHQRHSIGFRILDALADRHHLSWHTKGEMEYAEWQTPEKRVLLIKPQTFVNESGKVIPALSKQGITAQNILVVHDELEQAFGKIRPRVGGSHRGHNGLRSLIECCGAEFARLRIGIGRPEDKEQVPEYVLSPFDEPKSDVEELIERTADLIEQALKVA